MARTDSGDSLSRPTGPAKRTSVALGMALCAAMVGACSSAAGPIASGTTGLTPTASNQSPAAVVIPTTAPVACDVDNDTADAPPPSEALVAKYAAAVKADPQSHDALLYLGDSYYQLARETADPTDYNRADDAFNQLVSENPNDVEALIGQGTIALARHQFAEGLAIGQKALTLSPGSALIYGVIGDAENELGQYDAAAASIDTMARMQPDLSSYSRVSYVRELRGDLPGAITAMETAIEAGGPAVENTAYLRVILGNLQFTAGDLTKADGAYRTTLQLLPSYVFALAGVARVDAARGDLVQAIACDQAAADRVPFPEFLIAEGEAQQAAGDDTDAQKTYTLVRQIEALFKANGVNTDLDLALFESEHGDPTTALTLAQAAYAATPNIKAADALGWALYQSGQLDQARKYADESLKLGTRDPSYAYHAGMIAKAQGDTDAARTWLTQSLASNPAWSPLYAPRAQAALAALGGPVANR